MIPYVGPDLIAALINWRVARQNRRVTGWAWLRRLATSVKASISAFWNSRMRARTNDTHCALIVALKNGSVERRNPLRIEKIVVRLQYAKVWQHYDAAFIRWTHIARSDQQDSNLRDDVEGVAR